MRFRRFSVCVIFTAASLLSAQQSATGEPKGHSVAASKMTQLSGSVVDTTGAVIAGADVELRSANGFVLRTVHSDKNGAFLIAQIAPGNYRLDVLSLGFEPKEILVDIEVNGSPAPLRIPMVVATVSTTVNVQGRKDDLIGIAESGTQGTVGATEIQDRPILRSGEILETVPGLIITQHAGGGKANQYYLRGFNLDHGTDFAIFIDDMPLNLPSHAHGEGYSDMNTVIAEFVEQVNFEKGPYYANVGNYGSAGSAHIEYFKTLPLNFVKVEGGSYTYGRTVFGASQKLASGNLLYGAEEYYDNGPWVHPDGFNKINALLTYSRGDEANGAGITAHAYHGKWNSSDQIPVNAVPVVGLYGTLDSTDGGRSQRYSVLGEEHRQSTNSASKISAYLFYYDLDLFSNFTYYLTDFIHGDQFEQQDKRWVTGMDARHAIFSHWHGHPMENSIGLQLRNDWIKNGLYATEKRMRMVKIDFVTGTPLPATTERDNFTDTIGSAYVENKTQWRNKFRSVLALRGDDDKFVVTSLAYSATVNAANSGSNTKFLPSPKANLIFGPWANTELYLQGGFSFHSNDGRGATQTVEPVSADNPNPNTTSAKIPPLVQTKGAEIGARTNVLPHLQSTLSLWYLHSNSELMQDGDTGGTSASEQSSNRYGVEWANYYTPREHVAIDFDFANSCALFTENDEGDAAPGSDGGKRVPEAVRVVISSGITLRSLGGFTSSLRLRYFGPRDLTSDEIFRSNQTVLLNGEISYQIREKWRFSSELLNMLNRRDSDIDYAYTSRISPTAVPEFTRVAHPVEPLQVRFSLGRSF